MANPPLDPVAPIVIGKTEWTKDDDAMCEELHQSKFWFTIEKAIQRFVDERNSEILDLEATPTEIWGLFYAKRDSIRTLQSFRVFLSHAGKRLQNNGT